MVFTEKQKQFIADNGFRIIGQSSSKVPTETGWNKKSDSETMDYERPSIKKSPMYAILTGYNTSRKYTLIVLDVDRHDENERAFNDLALIQKIAGKADFETYTVKTPGNGLHIYYKVSTPFPVSTPQRILGSIEVKNNNALITGAGSIGQNGLAYEVVKDLPIMELPESIGRYLNEQEQKQWEEKPAAQEHETVFNDEDKQTIFDALLELAQKGVFQEHEDRVRIGRALYNTGYSLADWQALSFDNPKCEKDWQYFGKDKTTIGTIFWYLKKNEKYVKLTGNTDTDASITIRNYYRADNEDGTEGKGKIPYTNLKQQNPDAFIPLKFMSALQDSSGKRFLFSNKNPDLFVNKFSQLPALVAEHSIGFDFIQATIGKAEYLEYLNTDAKTYTRFSCVPETKQNADTFFLPFEIEPHKNGYFRKLLDTLQFADDKYRYRFATLFLSAFLPSNFDGKKPLFSLLSSIHGSGKTTTATAAVKIITGKEPIRFEGKDEDAQQINGVSAFANKFVLYDNIQSARAEQLRKIAEQATSDTIASWLFGASHSRVRNNKSFIMTMNTTESVSPDVKDRMLTVRLKQWGDTQADKTERYKVIEALNYAVENREHILADIMAVLFGEKEQNDDDDIERIIDEIDKEKNTKLIPHSRFLEWSKTVFPYLCKLFPEVECFDLSLQEEDENLNTEYTAWQDVFEQLLDDTTTDSWHFSTQEIYNEYVATYGDKEYFCKSIILFARRLNSVIAGIKGYTVEPKRTNKKKGYVISREEKETEQQAEQEQEPAKQAEPQQEPAKQAEPQQEQVKKPYKLTAAETLQQKRDKILAEMLA